jgi:hypothetical protein
MEKYIIIKDQGLRKKRIKNPCFDNDGISYSGSITDFSFTQPGLNQQSNYDKLQETLIPFGEQLTYIWCCSYTVDRNRTTFVAKSQNNNFFWYKYDGPSPGSGQNYLYVYGKKTKLYNWLNCNDITRNYQVTLFSSIAENIN